MATGLGHCYVCGRPLPREDFYVDNSRNCRHQSKCKECADRRSAERRGYVSGGGDVSNFDSMTDLQFMDSELNRNQDLNYLPRETFNGASTPDGVRSVRGKATRNVPASQRWGSKIRTPKESSADEKRKTYWASKIKPYRSDG